MLATTMSKAADKSNTDAQRIRRKYPDKVPIICVDKSGIGQTSSGKPSKLLVPDFMNGKALKKAVYEKVPSSIGCVLMLGKNSPQFPLLDDDLVSTLDNTHMHPDGFLYVTFHTEQQAKQLREAIVGEGSENKESSPRARAASLEVFNMADQEGDDQDLEQYSERIRRVMKKNPDRVPVRCRQDADAKLGIPSIDKKLLAPSKMFFSEFEKVVHKYIPQPVDHGAKLYVEGCQSLEMDAPMADIHEQYKADDGLLYIHYGLPVKEQAAKEMNETKEIPAELQEQVMVQLQKVQQASEEDLGRANKEIVTLLEDKDKMRSEIANLKQTLPGLYGEIADRDAEIQKAQQLHKCDTDMLQGQLEELTKEFTQADKEREEMAAFKVLAKAKEADFDCLKVESSLEILDLSKQLEALNGVVEKSKASAEETERSLQQQLSEKENDVRDLKAQLEDVIGQSRQLQDTRAAVEKEVLVIKSKMEAEQESLRSQLQNVSAQSDSIQKAAECELKEQSVKHSAEIASLKAQSLSESTKFSEAEGKLQDKLSKQEAQLQEAKAEADKHHVEATALRMQLEKLEKKADDDWEVLETPLDETFA